MSFPLQSSCKNFITISCSPFALLVIEDMTSGLNAYDNIRYKMAMCLHPFIFMAGCKILKPLILWNVILLQLPFEPM
jgi:hypothetical protein